MNHIDMTKKITDMFTVRIQLHLYRMAAFNYTKHLMESESLLGRRGREVNTIDPNVTVKSHHSDCLQEEKYKHKKEIVILYFQSHNFSFLYYV